MWKRVGSKVISLGLLSAGGLSSAPAQEAPARAPVTYWQENRCRESPLGDGASLRWCVDSVVVAANGALELHLSWKSSGLSGKRLFKGSDARNRGMYLLDDLGKRYEHIDTRGAARDGGRLDDDHALLRGAFVFPPPQPGATRFTFHDTDQRAFIPGIVLSPEFRTDPATSASVLSRLKESQTLRIHASFRGANEVQEQYSLSRTPRGFRLESGTAEIDPELLIPPPVMELFFQTLAESPLLERPYEPAPVATGDYPATTLDLRTEAEDVIFFSRSEGDRNLPWRVESGGKVYLVPDDSPLRGLEVLDPFLERDPQSRALRLLSPHVDGERAAELWAKLDGPLEADEALRVVRRLKDLLEREVEETEIWQAVDEYVARSAPPDPRSIAAAPRVSDERLFEAAEGGDVEAVRRLASSGAALDTRGRDGKTALMLAAEKGRVETVQALLESGASPDVQTLRGNTALGLAARNHHLETVKLLLQSGADPKRKDTHGATPLMETTEANIARALIRGGADVNAADDRGLTPMMRLIAAAGPGSRAETLRALLAAGANVRARDREGRTALIWAIKGTPSSRSYPDLVSLLIAAGSELEARDREGGTPLVYAAVRGDTASARLLVDAGADVNARMGNLSAIEIALRYGRSEIVTLLVRAGARR